MRLCWHVLANDLNTIYIDLSHYQAGSSFHGIVWTHRFDGCVFDSSTVVALVHLFEERIHVGQGYAPPPRATWSISFRWVTSLHEVLWFSGNRHWILMDIAWLYNFSVLQFAYVHVYFYWLSNWQDFDVGGNKAPLSASTWYFFSPRSNEESKPTRRPGRVRSEWYKYRSGRWHAFARVFICCEWGFSWIFMGNASTRPFRLESRRCQDSSIIKRKKWRPQRPTPITSLWFSMISPGADDEQRRTTTKKESFGFAFISFGGLEWHHEVETTIWAHSRGRGQLTW